MVVDQLSLEVTPLNGGCDESQRRTTSAKRRRPANDSSQNCSATPRRSRSRGGPRGRRSRAAMPTRHCRKSLGAVGDSRPDRTECFRQDCSDTHQTQLDDSPRAHDLRRSMLDKQQIPLDEPPNPNAISDALAAAAAERDQSLRLQQSPRSRGPSRGTGERRRLCTACRHTSAEKKAAPKLAFGSIRRYPPDTGR